MNISGPAAVAKPEMLFYAPGDLTVTHKVCTKAILLGERSVRIRKVEGSTPFESIKRRIVLNDTAFLFAILCKIVHHSS